MNSAGSAMKENEVYINSISGKISNLKSAFEDFSRNTIDSQFVKSLVDAGTALIKFADSDFGRFLTVEALTVTALGLLTKGFGTLRAAILTNGQALLSYLLAMQGVPVAEAAATASTLGLAGSIKLLTKAVITNPLFIGITAITAIYGIKKAIESLDVTFEEQIEKVNKASEAYNEAKNNLDKNTESLKKKKDELQKINKLEKENPTEKYDLQKRSLEAEISTLSAKEKVLQNIEKIEKEGAHKETKKALEKTEEVTGYTYTEGRFSGSATVGKYTYDETRGETKKVTQFEKLNILMENYNTLLKQQEVLTKGTFETEGNFVKRKENLQEQLDKTKSAIVDTSKVLVDLKDNLDLSTREGQSYSEQIDASVGKANNFIDKLNGVTEATDNLTEAEKKYNEEMSNSQETQKKQEENFKNSVDDLAKLQENYNLLTQAQNEYNETGYLTADMYKKLQDAGLLQYLDETNGKLTFNTKEFNNNRKEIIASATDSIKKAYAEKVLQLALADQNGTLKEVAKSFGLVTEESNKVDSSNTVSQIARIGTMAASIFPTLGKVFNKVKQIFGQKTSDDGGLFDVSKYTGSEEYNKYKAELDKRMKADIAAINKVKLESAKVSKPKGKSTSGSKSKSRKSAKDTYKAEINLLYKYENALENAEEKVKKLQKALGNTENFSKQEKILKNLIKATDNQKKKTNDLRKAQKKQIKNYIKQLKKAGFQIKYNSKDNELNIKNMKHLKKFTGDTAKKYEEMIKNIQSLNKENRSLSESITDLAQDMKDYNEELNDIPTKKLEKYNELMEEFRQSRLDQIQGEITDLEREMKKDTKLNKLKAELEEMEKQNDALDSQNDKQEKLLALEQAKENLANKREQKNIQVFRERGWLGLRS